MGIEMVAKAKSLGLPVAEIPTIWLERAEGTSNFRVSAWITRYFHWYLTSLIPSRGSRHRARGKPGQSPPPSL
jgi:hypothetical protein